MPFGRTRFLLWLCLPAQNKVHWVKDKIMSMAKMVVHALLTLLVFACAMVVDSREGLAQAADSGLDIRVNFRVPFSVYKHNGYPELLGYDLNRPPDFCAYVPDIFEYGDPECYYSERPAVTAFLGGSGVELAIGYRWKYFGIYMAWNIDALKAAYIRGSGENKTLEMVVAYLTLRGFIPINDIVYIDIALALGIGGRDNFRPYGFAEDYRSPTMIDIDFASIALAVKGSVGFTYFLDDWFGIGAEVTYSGFLFGTPSWIIAPAFRTVFQF